MVIIDDFIKDRTLLEEVSASCEFHTARQWGWWDANSPPRNLRERVLDCIWGAGCPVNVLRDRVGGGIEYWTLAHGHSQSDPAPTVSPGKDRLIAHRDRDEALFSETGKEVHPRMGSVYYPIEHDVSGGWLHVYDGDVEDGASVKVEPKHNRLVMFDVSKLHEVTPVISGLRYAMASNIWDYKIATPPRA